MSRSEASMRRRAVAGVHELLRSRRRSSARRMALGDLALRPAALPALTLDRQVGLLFGDTEISLQNALRPYRHDVCTARLERLHQIRILRTVLLHGQTGTVERRLVDPCVKCGQQVAPRVRARRRGPGGQPEVAQSRDRLRTACHDPRSSQRPDERLGLRSRARSCSSSAAGSSTSGASFRRATGAASLRHA